VKCLAYFYAMRQIWDFFFLDMAIKQPHQDLVENPVVISRQQLLKDGDGKGLQERYSQVKSLFDSAKNVQHPSPLGDLESDPEGLRESFGSRADSLATGPVDPPAKGQ
jgi:hypothetical protein